MPTLKTAVTDWIRLKTQGSDPATPAAGFGAFYDKGKAPYYVNSDGTVVALTPAASITDGWYAASGTWSYSSADAPTFVISVNADVTGQIGVGMKIKLTQTTVKYFIVMAVGAYGGGVTLVTVYGGTDYTLISAAISSPYYSLSRAALGFPMSPAKWTVETTDTSARAQATPTQNQWYNINTTLISIPIGVWRAEYAVNLLSSDASATAWTLQTTLSTANNSESSSAWTARVVAASAVLGITVYRSGLIEAAAKTPYYLNTRTISASLDNIYNGNDTSALYIRAVCAYL